VGHAAARAELPPICRSPGYLLGAVVGVLGLLGGQPECGRAHLLGRRVYWLTSGTSAANPIPSQRDLRWPHPRSRRRCQAFCARRLGRRLTTSPASAANVMAGSDMHTVRTDRSISSAGLSPTRGCVNAAAAT
jgi:hypothetical protein